MNTTTPSLVNQLIGFGGLQRTGRTLVVAILLILPLLAATFAHGRYDAAAAQTAWRLGLAPALIVFILEIHPWLQRHWRVAIDALRPLARQPELVDPPVVDGRLGEWLALLAGAAFAVWIGMSTELTGWAFYYLLATNIVMFALTALSIFDGLSRTSHFKRAVNAGLALDLFDRRALAPLARFGQSISLAFVGGICLSLLFQSPERLNTVQSLVTYSILIVTALTVFFMSIWSIHAALVAAQERELAIVRQHWNRARGELLQRLAGTATATGAGADSAAGLYEPLVVFGTYERQVLEASTWPFNPKIVKEVVASLVAPILIYGIKLAIGLSGNA